MCKKGTREVHVYYKDGIINSDHLLTNTVMSIIILFLTETMEIVAMLTSKSVELNI